MTAENKTVTVTITFDDGAKSTASYDWDVKNLAETHRLASHIGTDARYAILKQLITASDEGEGA